MYNHLLITYNNIYNLYKNDTNIEYSIIVLFTIYKLCCISFWLKKSYIGRDIIQQIDEVLNETGLRSISIAKLTKVYCSK